MTRRGATRGAYVIAAITGALFFAARTTGAGWLMVILCVLLGTLAIAAAWPRIALTRVRVRATGPTDAVAGEPVELQLHVANPGLGVRLRPVDIFGDWSAAVGPHPTSLTVTPDRRGVLAQLAVEVSSAAPFGLVWWRRTIAADLDRPIDVAPQRADVPRPVTARGAHGGSATASHALMAGETIRSVREYRAGDPLRLVHWPATAHRGSVVVKELELPERPHWTVVVDVSGASEPAERAAERAMGVVCDALDAGVDVTLCTIEAGGPVSAAVTSPVGVGRRLARAVSGVPTTPVAAPGRNVILISGRGDR